MSKSVVHFELTLEEANLVIAALEAFQRQGLIDGETAVLSQEKKDAQAKWDDSYELLAKLRKG